MACPRQLYQVEHEVCVAFWRSLHKSLDTKLAFNIVCHPQTNEQIERTNHVIKNMFRTCCSEHEVSWVDLIPLMEFTYNNNYYTMIKKALYKTFHKIKCRSLVH